MALEIRSAAHPAVSRASSRRLLGKSFILALFSLSQMARNSSCLLAIRTTREGTTLGSPLTRWAFQGQVLVELQGIDRPCLVPAM